MQQAAGMTGDQRILTEDINPCHVDTHNCQLLHTAVAPPDHTLTDAL